MQNKTFTPLNIKNIQRYLIAWFLSNNWAKIYNTILEPKMFWNYQKLFIYISENWNSITPDLLKIISIEEYMDIMKYDSLDYIRNWSKYILELFDWYVKENLSNLSNIWEIKKIRDKIILIENWNWKNNNIKTLLFDVEKEIEVARWKKWKILWYETGIKTLDDFTEWLQKWTVMRLNAYSNVWKSKLSYFIANKILRQNLNVIYFSLEVTATRVALNLLANWYDKDYYTIAKGKELIDFSEYYNNNLEIVDYIYTIDEIIQYTEQKKPDVIFIDFIQNIKWNWNSEYERLTSIATEIQQLAIRNNIAIFDISQISNEWLDFKRWGIIPSKWSWWLVHSADVGLLLRKKDWRLLLNIAKNKFWQNDIEIELLANFSKWSFQDLWESEFWIKN